ncbi:MAG: phospholipase/carboxylesterase [Candidatus Midichloriaceae bacterium]|jgi:phospholipase/carboxylesterase
MLEYKEYIDSSVKKVKRILFMFHGYGSNMEDLINLSPELSTYIPDTLFISPNAPNKFEGNIGDNYRQWFSLSNRSKDYLLDGLESVENIVCEFIKTQLKKHELDQDNLCLLGFSQGTMLILHLVLKGLIHPKTLLGYSGCTIENDWDYRDNNKTTNIMLIHGIEDDVVNVKEMERSAVLLIKNGFKVETHISRYLAHGIDADGIKQGGSFLKTNS